MDMDSAAVFLAGSILYALGIIVILACVIFANNLIHKYWKSFGWNFFPGFIESQHTRFATDEELKTLDSKQEPKLK